MNKKLIIPGILFFIISTISAQEGYLEKKDSVYSQLLKQNRHLSVFLPEGYQNPGSRFPILFVLDADGRCQHTVPTALFLVNNHFMPKTIIVGLYNIDRNHDFLTASTPMAKTGGGADNFLEFFRQELIPYVYKNYKTEPYKVLIGHSFGALFAIHALLNDPGLFDAYIAIDPSFWYNNKQEVKASQQEFQKQKNWNKILFISGRDGAGFKDMGIDVMKSTLKNFAPKDLNWTCVSYSNEDHGSVPFKSVYDGLRYIFDNRYNALIFPQAGIIPRGHACKLFVNTDSKDLRYTIDGTEPTLSSPKCGKYIRIDHACIVKVKVPSFKYGSKPATTYVYNEGEAPDALEKPENAKQGLRYSYYEGCWDSLPDFSKLNPKKTGITDSIDLRAAAKKDSFAFQFEGYVYIREKAIYNFYVVSDDGSKVFLDNKMIMNNDGLHSANMPVTYMIPLKKGYYPIKILFFEKNGDESIAVGYQTGKKKPANLPKELLFYKE